MVDDVDAIHFTAPYCAVKFVAVNGTVVLDKFPRLNDAVGACVKPVVAQVVESVWVKVPPPPAQKLPVTLGFIVSASEIYRLAGLDR